MTDGPDDDHKYDDIIDLAHHRSTKHPHMPLADRAAQFSPFAALTGHGDAVRETARLTDSKMELGEEVKTYLNARLSFLADNIKEQPEISITYFLPDERKAGGAYLNKTGSIKKINEYEQTLVMLDGDVIPIDDIVAIDGELFNQIEADS